MISHEGDAEPRDPNNAKEWERLRKIVMSIFNFDF